MSNSESLLGGDELNQNMWRSSSNSVSDDPAGLYLNRPELYWRRNKSISYYMWRMQQVWGGFLKK